MEDNFSLFDNALTTFENDNKKSDNDNGKCKHLHMLAENGITLCEDCGEEITRDISFDKEWRYYGASDTKHNSDPNRCHVRKSEDRTIYKDVEGMGFSDKILTKANELYIEVTKGKIYRGNSRKAIVFACVFHTYKSIGNPQSCDNLIEIFNLKRKIGLRGLKHVNLNAPKDSEVHNTYITPENLIKEIMDKFDANEYQINDVINLYKKIKNKSSILNRSRPQSVASGLVRYYILKNNKDISLSEFKDKVNLSELTINRICKEITKILES
tara:strand:- start:2539 stop:3348 length:810 start_codon:yes stop_codon:yes gene_type:complete